MLGFAVVVELLAHPRADLLGDLAGVDRRIEAAMQREGEFELLQVRLDGGLHVGILQLARERRPLLRGGAVNLSEGSGRRRLEVEGAEPGLPVRTEFRLHPALDEGSAHRRRLGLQLLEFGGIFRRNDVRDGGEQLRHLHDRPLQPSESLRQRCGIRCALPFAAHKPRAGHARGDPADIRADAGIACRARGETVCFAIAVVHPLPV